VAPELSRLCGGGAAANHARRQGECNQDASRDARHDNCGPEHLTAPCQVLEEINERSISPVIVVVVIILECATLLVAVHTSHGVALRLALRPF